MKKSVLILGIALLPIVLQAQVERLLDSVLIYSFAQNGDSMLSVSDVRTYNNGLLHTRIQNVYRNRVVPRSVGEYNATYSYTDNGNERKTIVSYTDNNGDIVEQEVYTYKDTEMEYLLRSPVPYNGSYVLADYWKRTYKGIRDYTYTHLFEEATGYAMSIYDLSELPLYHADTIIFERITGIDPITWETLAKYVFYYNESNVVDHVDFLPAVSGSNPADFKFIYNENGQCIKIEYFKDISITSDSTVSVKSYEITQTLNEDNQPLVVTYYTINHEHDPYLFNLRITYDYFLKDILTKSIYQLSDTTDPGVLVERTYYFYNPKNNITEHTANPVSVFPNPAQTQFTVTHTENATVTLYNLLGQKVRQLPGKEENTIICTEDLPQGVYLLKVEKENAVLTKKVQIIR